MQLSGRTLLSRTRAPARTYSVYRLNISVRCRRAAYLILCCYRAHGSVWPGRVSCFVTL